VALVRSLISPALVRRRYRGRGLRFVFAEDGRSGEVGHRLAPFFNCKEMPDARGRFVCAGGGLEFFDLRGLILIRGEWPGRVSGC